MTGCVSLFWSYLRDVSCLLFFTTTLYVSNVGPMNISLEFVTNIWLFALEFGGHWCVVIVFFFLQSHVLGAFCCLFFGEEVLGFVHIYWLDECQSLDRQVYWAELDTLRWPCLNWNKTHPRPHQGDWQGNISQPNPNYLIENIAEEKKNTTFQTQI